MKIVKTIKTTDHLCDTCKSVFATCKTGGIEFGNGIGNDNVIKCGEYLGDIIAGKMEIVSEN